MIKLLKEEKIIIYVHDESNLRIAALTQRSIIVKQSC